MVNKQLIQSIISKYYLDVNESVKWVVEDNVLTIDFMSPNRDVIGKVTCKDFELDDVELAIFNTKKLSNLLNICDQELLFKIKQQGKTPIKLLISDSKYDLEYALASPLVIDSVGTVNEVEWEVILTLDSEDISNIIKAKSAVNDAVSMRIQTDITPDKDYVCKFSFGDEAGHNNTVTYQVICELFEKDVNLPFNSQLFRSILKANKDPEISSSRIYINSQGLMKIEFNGDQITSSYYMVRLEETNF